MTDAAFRDKQLAGVREPHVLSVNALVDELRDRQGRGAVAHLAPLHGGIGSLLLVLLPGPGPAEGLLCVENDDPVSVELGAAFTGLGIPPSTYTVWNAYPWATEDRLDDEHVTAGVDPLLRLVDLLPELQLVLLCGRTAQSAWAHALKRRPYLERSVATVAAAEPGTDPAANQASYVEVQQLLWTL